MEIEGLKILMVQSNKPCSFQAPNNINVESDSSGNVIITFSIPNSTEDYSYVIHKIGIERLILALVETTKKIEDVKPTIN